MSQPLTRKSVSCQKRMTNWNRCWWVWPKVAKWIWAYWPSSDSKLRIWVVVLKVFKHRWLLMKRRWMISIHRLLRNCSRVRSRKLYCERTGQSLTWPIWMKIQCCRVSCSIAWKSVSTGQCRWAARTMIPSQTSSWVVSASSRTMPLWSASSTRIRSQSIGTSTHLHQTLQWGSGVAPFSSTTQPLKHEPNWVTTTD